MSMGTAKATHETDRNRICDFEQIVNVGPATAQDFRLLGFKTPQELIGQDPANLFVRLNKATKTRQDPCVLDVLMASIDFMNGGPPKPWWDFTDERKKKYSHLYQD